MTVKVISPKKNSAVFIKNLGTALKNTFNEEDKFFISSNNIEDAFKNLKSNIQTDDIFIINGLEDDIDDKKNRIGLNALKWLRIKYQLLNPIVLLTKYKAEAWLKLYPQDIIIASEGVRFFKYFDDIIDNFPHLQPLISKETLNPFIKADFNIQDIGHSWANYFGLILMEDAHSIIRKNKISFLSNEVDFPLLEKHKASFLYTNLKNDDQIEKCRVKLDTIKTLFTYKRILSIDDQGNDGWFKCYENLFYKEESENFYSYSPVFKSNNEIEIILKKISSSNPDIIFLDLRLQGEKEKYLLIDDISGYKVLKKIKEFYPSIPILIMSATNKAENLTALLKAGASGLWTKPRVETNNLHIYEHYYELLDIVQNIINANNDVLSRLFSVSNFRIGQLMSSRKDFDIYIKKTLNFDNLKNLDTSLTQIIYSNYIILDTNLFLYNKHSLDAKSPVNQVVNHLIVKYQIAVYTLFEICRVLDKKLIIIDDVMQELFLKTIQNDKNLKKIASQSIKLISRLKKINRKVIINEYEIINYSLRNKEVSKEKVQDDKYNVWKSEKRLVSIEKSENRAENKKDELKKADKGILHADDTIKGLIYQKFLNQTVQDRNTILLINDDNGCKYEVSTILDSQLGTSTSGKPSSMYEQGKLLRGYSFKKDLEGNTFIQCNYASNEDITKKIYSELVVKFLSLNS
jgi:CheY-like chemotaxis protein